MYVVIRFWLFGQQCRYISQATANVRHQIVASLYGHQPLWFECFQGVFEICATKVFLFLFHRSQCSMGWGFVLAKRHLSKFCNTSTTAWQSLGIFSFEDDQNQVRHRTEYRFGVSLLSSVPSMAHCCRWQSPLLLSTFNFVWTLLCFCLFWGGVNDPVCSANAKTWCTCASQHLSLKNAFVQMNL